MVLSGVYRKGQAAVSSRRSKKLPTADRCLSTRDNLSSRQTSFVMKKIFLLFLLPLFFPLFISAQGSVRTTYSESYDRWDVNAGGSGSLSTTYSNSYDNWQISIGGVSGTIRTTYSSSYGDWEISIGGKSYKLRTTYSNSYDNWELTGGDLKSTIKISTTYSSSYDNWQLDGAAESIRISTTYSKSYDNWNISGNLTNEEAGVKAAAAFIPAFVGAIYNKGLTK
jgi:hypothetical protein